MPISSYTQAVGDAWRSAGDFASGLVRPTLKLGVTGLARSGKTVFITALVHNLMAGARLPFFEAAAQGRLVRAYLEPQPDEIVPRFEFEKHLAALTATPPRWPESTRRISQLRLTLEYVTTSFWKPSIPDARARKISAIPPVAILSTISYLPSFWPPISVTPSAPGADRGREDSSTISAIVARLPGRINIPQIP